MANRSIPTLIFVLALALTAVGATHAAASEAFAISLEPIIDQILPNEAAMYKLTVTNFQNNSDAFIVSTDDLSWIADSTDILSDVPSGQTRETVVEISAKGFITPGTRLIPIKVRSANTKEFLSENAIVGVRSADGGGRQYAPSIFLSAKLPDNVDPREPFILSVYLRNRNARDYPALIVDAQSTLVSQRYTTTLGSVTGDDGEKTNQLTLSVDEDTPPGTYPITVTIIVDNQTANTFQTNIIVVSYEQEGRTESSESTWFKTIDTYAITNNGNTPRTLSVEHGAGWLARLFTTSPQAYTVQGDAIVFSARLEPNESAEYTVVTNYRLLAILALVVILSIVAYFVLRSPVIVRKEAQLKGGHDGISEVRVRLHIRNRAAGAVHSLHVVDKVTSMADIAKEAKLGTLQPSKVVRKPGHGTLVRWDIDTLDGFEERIITYTAKTKLKLIGDVYLPAAKVKFDHGGRERTVYSNEVNIDREA
jgi:hypothetical protein